MDESPQGARQGNGDDFRSSIERGRQCEGVGRGGETRKRKTKFYWRTENGSDRRDSWQQRGRQQ